VWEVVFRKKFGIAHVPQRFWAEDPHGRGVRRRRVVGASDDVTYMKVLSFLKSVNMPVFPAYGLEIAEVAKVAENAYRYVMIAFAEELYGACKEMDVDFWAVKEAIETHQSIGYILEPRKGIGGHCLPMAADIMEDLTSVQDIIVAAKLADKRYRKLLEDE
jgi:UDP-N-acetyl-D-mannosaminuronate dehydrogenase